MLKAVLEYPSFLPAFRRYFGQPVLLAAGLDGPFWSGGPLVPPGLPLWSSFAWGVRQPEEDLQCHGLVESELTAAKVVARFRGPTPTQELLPWPVAQGMAPLEPNVFTDASCVPARARGAP